jgi:hypothetical protein
MSLLLRLSRWPRIKDDSAAAAEIIAALAIVYYYGYAPDFALSWVAASPYVTHRFLIVFADAIRAMKYFQAAANKTPLTFQILPVPLSLQPSCTG